MSQFNIRPIPANLVDHFWKLAEPYIKRALDNTCGEFLPIDIKNFANNQIIQLWMISEGEKVIGACTTEIVNYPQRRHCRVLTVGGSRAKEWMEELDIILCNWAKQQGCVGMETYVKKSLVPVLANYAYEHTYSVVTKALKE